MSGREDVRLYWLWLQHALGAGSRKTKAVLERFDSISSFYHGGEREWRLCGCFNQKELSQLKEATLGEAEAVIKRSEALGLNILTPEEFPERLLEIANPPCALFLKGELPNLDEEAAVAIVGTRSATPYGLEMAFELAFQLSKAGVVVVSGGALGVDASSHKGALQAGGKTIAVLGCGVNYDYLRTNASLRHTIANQGALVSEYPPDSPAPAYHFPIRNRLISALSLGTLVIEAGEKSGSLITANLALEQGRDVFALPGSVQSSVSRGTNNLIKAGAKPVTDVEDILEEYRARYSAKIKTQRMNASEQKEAISHTLHKRTREELKKEGLSEDAVLLYLCMESEPRHIDVLLQQAGLNVPAAMQALTELELLQLARAWPGRQYSYL